MLQRQRPPVLPPLVGLALRRWASVGQRRVVLSIPRVNQSQALGGGAGLGLFYCNSCNS